MIKLMSFFVKNEYIQMQIVEIVLHMYDFLYFFWYSVNK